MISVLCRLIVASMSRKISNDSTIANSMANWGQSNAAEFRAIVSEMKANARENRGSLRCLALSDTSVIICFHSGAWSVLRTFASVLKRAISNLILVDDSNAGHAFLPFPPCPEHPSDLCGHSLS